MDFKKIYSRDRFANENGIILGELNDEHALMSVTVEQKHLNGADSVHGGVLFLLADIAMAALANFKQPISLSIQSDIRFLATAFEGDTLTAEALWVHGGRKLSNCHVNITNQKGELIAVAEGMFHTKRVNVEGVNS